MSDINYMQLAIQLAKTSQEKIPVGVIILEGEQIIARAVNSHHADNDATAHAEIKAIRQACKQLGQKNLHGCTVYTTCEPCTMCGAALLYAEVDRIVFGARMADIDPNNQRISITLQELASRKPVHPTIDSDIARDKCLKELYE